MFWFSSVISQYDDANNPGALKSRPNLKSCNWIQLVHNYVYFAFIMQLSKFQVVDVRRSSSSDCLDTYVYVADVTGFGILVVDVARDRSWRVTHRLMYPFPSRGTFTIDGKTSLILLMCYYLFELLYKNYKFLFRVFVIR